MAVFRDQATIYNETGSLRGTPENIGFERIPNRLKQHCLALLLLQFRHNIFRTFLRLILLVCLT